MSFQFLAVLDHFHLEDAAFLRTFADAIASLGNRKGLIVHGDSPYTDRIIQTGVMREDAELRAVQDLNKRLIGLLADQGVPAIGLHGFQKELIQKKNDEIILDHSALRAHHAAPNLILSNLIAGLEGPELISLPKFCRILATELDPITVLLFSKDKADELFVSSKNQTFKWNKIPPEFTQKAIPDEFQNFNHPATLTTAGELKRWPSLQKKTLIT